MPKTRLVFVVQGNYGQGWEDVTEEATWFGGKNRLREYNEKESNPHRLIKRRIPYYESNKEHDDAERKAYVKRMLEAREKKRSH